MKSPKRKFLFLSIISIFILTGGFVQAAQPKILEVTDNFGNTFNFNEEKYSDFKNIKEEVIVTEDTSITLCVSELKASESDKITYEFEMEGGHPDDVSFREGGTTENCNTWELKTEDYSEYWSFVVRMRNQDDVYYGGSKERGDYWAEVKYENLVPESNDRQIIEYDTIKISKSEYEDLKDSAPDEAEVVIEKSEYEDLQESKEETNVPEGKKLVDEEEWTNLNQKIEEKNNRIEELEKSLKEFNDTINQLKEDQKSEERKGSSEEGQKGEVSGEGFFGNLFGGLFG